MRGLAKDQKGRPLGTRLSKRQQDVLDQVCGWDVSVRQTAVIFKAGVPSIRRSLRAGLLIVQANLKAR